MKGLTGPIQPKVGDHLAKEWGPHINKTNGASVYLINLLATTTTTCIYFAFFKKGRGDSN